jgi:hypothetical protein
VNQLSFILDAPAARRRDPETSKAAAAAARQVQADHCCLILGALMAGPAGVDRIAALTKLTTYQVSKRMAELERSGAAKLTGRTVQSAAGRAQREWERA